MKRSDQYRAAADVLRQRAPALSHDGRRAAIQAAADLAAFAEMLERPGVLALYVVPRKDGPDDHEYALATEVPADGPSPALVVALRERGHDQARAVAIASDPSVAAAYASMLNRLLPVATTESGTLQGVVAPQLVHLGEADDLSDPRPADEVESADRALRPADSIRAQDRPTTTPTERLRRVFPQSDTDNARGRDVHPG